MTDKIEKVFRVKSSVDGTETLHDTEDAAKKRLREVRFEAALRQAIGPLAQPGVLRLLLRNADKVITVLGQYRASASEPLDRRTVEARISTIRLLASVWEQEATDAMLEAQKAAPINSISDLTPALAPIPDGVYWNEHHGEFYDAAGKGMGSAFYIQWHSRNNEFPRYGDPLAPIPPRVWWNADQGDFFDAEGGSMGKDFFDRWYDSREKFPQIGVDLAKGD